jgi:hypothetical protein
LRLPPLCPHLSLSPMISISLFLPLTRLLSVSCYIHLLHSLSHVISISLYLLISSYISRCLQTNIFISCYPLPNPTAQLEYSVSLIPSLSIYTDIYSISLYLGLSLFSLFLKIHLSSPYVLFSSFLFISIPLLLDLSIQVLMKKRVHHTFTRTLQGHKN